MSDDALDPEPLTLDAAPEPDPEAAEVAIVTPAEALPVEVVSTGFLPENDGRDQPPAPGSPAAPSPAPDPRLETLVARLDGLAEGLGKRLDALHASFEREVRAEATRERVVDRLHAELQEYKQDLLLSALRPVFIDLIQLHDDVGKLRDAIAGDVPLDPARARSMLDDVQQGLEDVLYRQGVEPFQVEGTAFDPRQQRAVATVETDDPSLGKTLAARLRKGFRAGEKVIRPEVVSVHALKK
jgi:molecular chaperone GrpE